MSKQSFTGVLALALGMVLGVAGWVGLSGYGSAEQPVQPLLRNPVEQREQIIHELQEIKEILKQQNDLLRQMKKG